MSYTEPPHRHELTPIGDELARRTAPLDIGEASRVDRIEREAASLWRHLPQPKTLAEHWIYGISVYLVAVALASGIAYLFGAIGTITSDLPDSVMFFTAFVVVGIGIATPPLIILPNYALRGWRPTMTFPRERRGPSDGPNDDPAAGVTDFGIWAQDWTFWAAVGVTLLIIGCAGWGGNVTA